IKFSCSSPATPRLHHSPQQPHPPTKFRNWNSALFFKSQKALGRCSSQEDCLYHLGSMSTDIGEPQQYKQASRKGKRAWRKHVDITEVQEGLRNLREEIIEG